MCHFRLSSHMFFLQTPHKMFSLYLFIFLALHEKHWFSLRLHACLIGWTLRFTPFFFAIFCRITRETQVRDSAEFCKRDCVILWMSHVRFLRLPYSTSRRVSCVNLCYTQAFAVRYHTRVRYPHIIEYIDF